MKGGAANMLGWVGGPGSTIRYISIFMNSLNLCWQIKCIGSRLGAFHL